jgi:predicted MFS family arabinose efflux permease
MDSSALFFGGIIGVVGIGLFIGIRFHYVSAKQTAIVMTILPIILVAIIVIAQKGEWLQIICMGPLLSLSFGPASYFLGRALENQQSNL